MTAQAGKNQTSGIDWASLILKIICGLIAFYLILPILIVLPMSFSSAEFLAFPPPGLSLKWFQRYFRDSSWIDPTIVSLQVALMAMLLSTTLGTLASMALVRVRMRGKSLINTFILFPMIIPVIILSIALYSFLTRLGLFGSRAGLVLGHSLLCIPFVVITVSASLKGFGHDLWGHTTACFHEDHVSNHPTRSDFRGSFCLYHFLRRDRDFHVYLWDQHKNFAHENVGRHTDGGQPRHCCGVYPADSPLVCPSPFSRNRSQTNAIKNRSRVIV